MFKTFKSIDENFQRVWRISILSIVCSAAVTLGGIYLGYHYANTMNGKIYVLINGSAFMAVAAGERDYLQIEARNHVKEFHQLIFNLDPMDKMIKSRFNQAFYLADGSARQFYDNLKESGYISGMISSNMIERVEIDSVSLYPAQDPYVFRFRCRGTETLSRFSSVTTRSLVTGGYLRRIKRSDDNSHGFLIERFEVLENVDQQTITNPKF